MNLYKIIPFVAILLFSIHTNAQVKPKPKPISNTKVLAKYSKLLVKSNVESKISINGDSMRAIKANAINTFQIPAGTNMINIVPTDFEKYLPLDTIITVQPEEQEILVLSFREKLIAPIDILKKVSKAMGLDEFGKSFNSIAFTIQGDKETISIFYLYPDKKNVYANLKQKDSIRKDFYNEEIYIDGNVYYRTFYSFFKQNGEDMRMITNRVYGQKDEDRAWSFYENPSISLEKNILTDILLETSIFNFSPQMEYENIGTEIIDGKAVVKIQGKIKTSNVSVDGKSKRTWITGYLLYIDKETNLPIKQVVKTNFYGNGEESEWQKEYTYSNYKFIAPITIPTKITAELVEAPPKNPFFGRWGSFSLENIKINPTISNPEKLFYRPAKIKSD